MRKNIIFAAVAVASSLLLAASCTKQDQYLKLSGSGKTFSAAIDNELTKTTLVDGTKVNWESGDLISINGVEYSANPQSDASKASFTKVSGSDPESPYSAIYPASLCDGVSFELPDIQEFSDGKFNAPMFAMSETENLSFKNICGVLCLSLKGTDMIGSISVTANEPLCGKFTMMDATTIKLKDTYSTVTLDCGSGVQLNSTTATDFYVYLPPKTYTAGMKVRIINADGDMFEMVTTSDATIERNNIYTFNWTPVFEWKMFASGTFDECPYFWCERESKILYYKQISTNLRYCKIPDCFGNESILEGTEYPVQDYCFYWDTDTNKCYIDSHWMGFEDLFYGSQFDYYNWYNSWGYVPGTSEWLRVYSAVGDSCGYQAHYDGSGTFYLADCYFRDFSGSSAGYGFWSVSPDTFTCD